MRLRAMLNRQSKRLQEVVNALHKMHKGKMTVLLSPDTIIIVAVPAGFHDAQAWATLRPMCPDDTGVFCNYFMIESQLDNKIGLEVDASLLILALKSSEASEQTVIKLRKRDGQAFLSFEIITNNSTTMTVIQDVPIRVLSGQQVDAIQEPQTENPIVRLISPPVKILSTVVERLKCLADRILLKANMNGEFEMGVTTDMAFMTNYWKDLAAPTVDGDAPPPRDASKRAEAYVDAALLSKVFSSHQIKQSHAICCMMEGRQRLVVWLLFLGNSHDCVTYFLPVLDG